MLSEKCPLKFFQKIDDYAKITWREEVRRKIKFAPGLQNFESNLKLIVYM